MVAVIRDVRLAIRSLARQPTFGLTVISMLTLAIAGNTAIFSVFNGLFLRPLPFPEPQYLVDLDETAPKWNLEFTAVNFREFSHWREHNTTFDEMAVYRNVVFNLSGEGEPERLSGAQVSHSMASVLRVNPVLGRHFTPEEDVLDGPNVIQLGHTLWRDRYGGDPDVLNKTITLDGERYTIVGVLPGEASFLGTSDYWLPLQTDASVRTGSWWLSGIGRLQPGVTIEQARTDLTRIHENAARENQANEDTAPVITPILDRALGDYRVGTTAMLGAVGIVLLITCANIAGLTMARSLSRRQEISIRFALGAGQWRVTRYLLAESFVLAAIGAITGTLLGRLAAATLRNLTDDALPAWVSFSLDARVIAFVMAVTLGAAAVFGFLPALAITGTPSRKAFVAVGTRATGTPGKTYGLNALVAAEIALAVTLLVAAGLSVRDFRALQRTDPGYRPDNVLTYRISLPGSAYDGSQRITFFDQHLERLRALPGVEVVGAATNPPLSFHNGAFFEIEDEAPLDPNTPRPVTLIRNITPGYLETIGATLLAGRSFTSADRNQEGSRVVIVNETFANHYWPEGNAIGKRIRTGSDSDWITVVGVARDVRHYGVDTEMRQGIYLPHVANQPFSMAMVIRASTDPLSLVEPARAVLREMDPAIPMSNISVMTQDLEDSLWARRAASWLAGTFSAVALILAVGGIYGVISYTVNQHTREIGIRMALGSGPGQELLRVLRQGALVIAVGVAIGLVGAAGAGYVLASVLVDVGAVDVTVYGTVTMIIILATIAANMIPARRASAIQPAEVLRGE